MFKKLHLTPPPTLCFGLSSGPPYLILEPPLQIIIAQSLIKHVTSRVSQTTPSTRLEGVFENLKGR